MPYNALGGTGISDHHIQKKEREREKRGKREGKERKKNTPASSLTA